MKKIAITLSMMIFIIMSIQAQNQTYTGQNLIVRNPPSYPYGINIDCDFPANWVREFNLTHSVIKNIFSLGAYASGSQLVYGYIGGGVTSTANYASPWIAFLPSGNIGIGTINPRTKLEVNGKIKSSSLDVAGTILAREVKVEITAGADHVFDKSYDLRPLSEVEQFVQENKHLPEIPSEKQMQEEGLNMNEFQIKLLQKIEELTLYTIKLKKEVDQLKAQNKN